MALPFLALYLTRSLGVSAARAGIVLAAYGVGALVTAPLSGRLADRVGPRRVMIVSLILAGAFVPFFPLIRDFRALVALTIAWAAVSEAFRPASLAILTEMVAPAQRKSAFALNRLAVNLGMSVGPAVGGLLATLSYRALFAVDGVTSIAAGIVLATTGLRASGAATPGPGASAPSSAPAPRSPASGVLADRHFLFFLLAMIPVLLVFFQHASSMPLFLVRDLRLSESAYGLLFTVNTVLIILVEVPLNGAMAEWSHARTLALGSFLSAVGFGAMAFAGNFIAVAATVVIWTFGEMMVFPASAAFVADAAPTDRRGQYMGLYQMTFSLAFTVGPWLGTIALDRLGARVLWGIAFAVGCVSTAMMWRVRARPS